MNKIDFNKDFSYPEPSDPEILSKIFQKREFYYYNVEKRDKLNTYEDVKAYRDLNCQANIKDPKEHQSIIANLINPNTPYKGIILMYGTGSGKTMAAIKIAEQFKEQISKYNTKIYVLVPGPNTRENFKKELIESTGNEYLKNKDLLTQLSKNEINYEKKIAIYNALQYYKILSYKTFYKKVLGEKIAEKSTSSNKKKFKISYKKNDKGEYEREQVIDKIINMNNSLLIIDEAHNISGNEYGEALKLIIKNSENLRIILLTATPMINLADEIVDLLNYIRPSNDMIQRDKIFTSEKNYMMNIKSNGIEYLKEKARGYISFFRGSIPYTFADRIDMGIIPEGMLFTPVIKCYMSDFQYNAYHETTNNFEDTLDRASSAASNFVFPGLNKNKDKLIGYYSNEGLITILSQLTNDSNKLKSMINKELFDNKLSSDEENNFIIENNKKNISGLILKLDYLKIFSIKFYTILNNINKLINDNCYTAFIYSNLVKAGGIELFAEILLQNGYLEYNEDSKYYDIKNDTIDYKTGLTYSKYKELGLSNFNPATFILITGGTDDSEELPEQKQKIIQDVFNNINNINGRYIKLILGSRVMSEGITLKNCKEVHIIDVFYNIPKIEQVIGRAIRMCMHMDVINDNYKYPQVNVYRYVVSIDDREKNKLSTDEVLYQKAELKYLVVKKIERALKEVSIDCPLLFNTNVFPEEIEKYNNCVYPTLENIKAKKKICPALCDFQECYYKCDSKVLDKYWDNNKLTYTKLNKDDINYNTFNDNIAKNEIQLVKNKIKDLFRLKYVYIYNELLDKIKKTYNENQSNLIEKYFLDKALTELMPHTENDFNNFYDIIYDKYNRTGYLIQRGIYYIFQPFNEKENITVYYRETYNIDNIHQNSIDNYIIKNYPNIIDKDVKIIKKNDISKINTYNFDDTLEYYNNRDENFIVGIIDNNFNKLASVETDLFKIRPKLIKTTTKKRGYGIHTLKGSVCTTKDKTYLIKILKKLDNLVIDKLKNAYDKKITKQYLANEIKNKLLYLEKYSTSKDNNKLTYVIIPKNHPNYPFPYNLEDRIKFIINNINNNISNELNILVKKKKDDDKNIIYELSCSNNKIIEKNKILFEKYGFEYNNNLWILLLS